MRRTLSLALALTVLGLIAASLSAASSSARPESAALRCKPGFKHAVIGGKQKCLKRGQRCKKRYDRQYHRYGFHCHNGRLTPRVRPRPSPPPPPPPPPAPAADLSVTVSDTPDPVTAGDELRITAVLENSGPDTAPSVRLTITLSSGAAFFTGATQGTCSGTSTIVCDLGSVAPGDTPSATVALNSAAPGTLTSSATVTAATADPSTDNNTATASTTVTSSHTAGSKTVSVVWRVRWACGKRVYTRFGVPAFRLWVPGSDRCP